MKVRLLVLWCTLASAAVWVERAQADVFRPAYLEVTEIGPNDYGVRLKVPTPRPDLGSPLKIALPDGARRLALARLVEDQSSVTSYETIHVEGGLTGRRVGVDGLALGAPIEDVLVRVVSRDGRVEVARLTREQPTLRVAARPSQREVFQSYVMLGIQHILSGLDHLAFVGALLLLVRGKPRIVGTVTAFTVAHSITLALATLGFVHVAQAPVEILIALSIALVALEIVRRHRGVPGLTSERPWLVAFCFGLLHGLGFAGALGEVGLPQHAIPLSLASFNVGVELGQLAFVGALLVLGGLIESARRRVPRIPLDERVPAYAMGGCAMFWVIERAVGLVG